MGNLEDMHRRQEWKGETLKKVVCAGNENASKRRPELSGDLRNVCIGLWEELEMPGHAGLLKKRYKTMGLAWVAFSLRHQEVPRLVGLRLETFQAFSDYVTGPEVAGMARQLDKATLDMIMETEQKVRNSWHEVVEATGATLNKAILDSIGANPTHTRSGLWQILLNSMMAKGTGKGQLGGGKGTKRKPGQQLQQQSFQQQQQQYQGGAWSQRNVAQRIGGKGKSQGKGQGKAKGAGKKGVKKETSNGPQAFAGKLKVCAAHGKGICFDAHLNDDGCTKAQCIFCHECCPEPGCRIKCGPEHGLWAH